MYCSKKTYEAHKLTIIHELAKLERLEWHKDSNVAESIFPYVLIEAINLLKNSTIIDSPTDYMKTGKLTEETINNILAK